VKGQASADDMTGVKKVLCAGKQICFGACTPMP